MTVIRRVRWTRRINLLKTNMDELALGRNGVSLLGGEILNRTICRATRRISGARRSRSPRICRRRHRHETGVSIGSPASKSALAGTAPSEGLASRAGVVRTVHAGSGGNENGC